MGTCRSLTLQRLPESRIRWWPLGRGEGGGRGGTGSQLKEQLDLRTQEGRGKVDLVAGGDDRE